MTPTYLGNPSLLKLHKTAFMAASTIPPEMVMGCYDWATKVRENGECVISGFSSKLEQDVLHFLLQGTQPIIIVLARRLYRKLPEEWQQPLKDGRLLIISTSSQPRQSRQSALQRNEYVAQQADRMLMVGVTEASSLWSIQVKYTGKLLRG